MKWVAILLVVIIAGAMMNNLPATIPEIYEPAQAEYVGGYRVIQRLNEEDVCLEVNGEAQWLTLMPTTEEVARKLLNIGDYGSVLGYVRSQGGDAEYVQQLIDSGNYEAIVEYCVRIDSAVG